MADGGYVRLPAYRIIVTAMGALITSQRRPLQFGQASKKASGYSAGDPIFPCCGSFQQSVSVFPLRRLILSYTQKKQ